MVHGRLFTVYSGCQKFFPFEGGQFGFLAVGHLPKVIEIQDIGGFKLKLK